MSHSPNNGLTLTLLDVSDWKTASAALSQAGGDDPATSVTRCRPDEPRTESADMAATRGQGSGEEEIHAAKQDHVGKERFCSRQQLLLVMLGLRDSAKLVPFALCSQSSLRNKHTAP